MELLEQLLLTMAHARCMIFGVVVVAEYVQDPVSHEQRDFVFEGACVRVSLVSRNRRADDHVAHQEREFA